MQNTQKNIDIFMSIIDNFGDIGFVLEFLYFFSKNYPNQYHFFVYCNNPESLLQIFAINNLRQNITVLQRSQQENISQVAIAFLHADFPKNQYACVLNVDYLSLDSTWIQSHETEHILSTKQNAIIEIIPSPIGAGGLLPKIAIKNLGDFQYLLEYKIISIFAYADTLARIDFSGFSDEYKIVIFGHPSLVVDFPPNVILMPFVSLDIMYGIFAHSEAIITRGEMSFMQVLQIKKPFFWDMYHQIGGINTQQGDDFLSFLGANIEYSALSYRLWHTSDSIQLLEYYNVLQGNRDVFIKKPSYTNLCEVIKKYLDKF